MLVQKGLVVIAWLQFERLIRHSFLLNFHKLLFLLSLVVNTHLLHLKGSTDSAEGMLTFRIDVG